MTICDLFQGRINNSMS